MKTKFMPLEAWLLVMVGLICLSFLNGVDAGLDTQDQIHLTSTEHEVQQR